MRQLPESPHEAAPRVPSRAGFPSGLTRQLHEVAFRGPLPQVFEKKAVRRVAWSGPITWVTRAAPSSSRGRASRRGCRWFPLWCKGGSPSCPPPKRVPRTARLVIEDRCRKSGRAEVITEPTGASWIMLWQAKTTFSQDSLSACPISKSPSVATLPA